MPGGLGEGWYWERRPGPYRSEAAAKGARHGSCRLANIPVKHTLEEEPQLPAGNAEQTSGVSKQAS